MAVYTATSAVHKTLVGAAVDTVTLTSSFSSVDILNRAASGAADVHVSWSWAGQTPANPTALGDDTEIVAAGMYVTIPKDVFGGSSVIVKVIGNGNAYSVIGKR